MKVDLTKNGLDSVFTPWQIKVLEILSDAAKTGMDYTSATLTETLNAQLGDGVSRASVIGFIDDLANWGIIQVLEGHKRGGKYGIYRFTWTIDMVERFVATRVEQWLKTLRHSSTKTVKGDNDE